MLINCGIGTNMNANDGVITGNWHVLEVFFRDNALENASLDTPLGIRFE